jgi:transposase InsO family protein
VTQLHETILGAPALLNELGKPVAPNLLQRRFHAEQPNQAWVAESFFSTLKTELIHRQSFPTRKAAADAIGHYIECFYNPIRKHSAVGYVSPVEYEMGVATAAVSL